MPQSSRIRSVLAVVVASLAYASPAAAQAPTNAPPPPAPLPPTTVTVTGTGTVKPTPYNPKRNASIVRAVGKAKAAVGPLAIADGTVRAAKLAALNGLALGKLLAITEGPSGATPPFYFVGPYGGQEGTFGPGKYCGTIRRAIVTRTKAGKLKRVRYRTIRTCRVPPQVSISYGMTFSTTPAA